MVVGAVQVVSDSVPPVGSFGHRSRTYVPSEYVTTGLRVGSQFDCPDGPFLRPSPFGSSRNGAGPLPTSKDTPL